MIIGIDLGTTNSAVAIWRDGRAELIPNSLGHTLTPSAVSVDEKTGEIMVGLAARERQSTHPDLTATVFKRYMGSQRSTTLGKASYLPEELSALVLKSLKADAEAHLGQPISEAVITVPAYFNDKQRKATRKAGQLAGLKVERLINEPTAAALAYGIHELEAESQFLIFDLGGGTFDVSILEIFEGVIEVRASTGDNRLGGEDFNEILVNAFKDAKGSALPGWNDPEAALVGERIREAAERARRALSTEDSAEMSVTWGGAVHSLSITAEMFETKAAALLERLREPVLRALRDSGIRAQDLGEIVMVGGSTRMPLVRKTVTRMFGRFPANRVNPDEAVALGAAVQAGLKARDVALKEVVLTDVCPYSLGIDVADERPDGSVRSGLFSPILERNTVIPASRVESYFTMRDNQPVITFGIYQGESRNVAENVKLATMKMPVPPARRGEIGIEVRFSYDINGLLEVDVHVPRTGERKQMVIVDEEAAAAPDFEERRKALSALKQHPREHDANRAALARAARCYEKFLGENREYIAHLTRNFETVLEKQDLKAIDVARGELLQMLDGLEGETWL
ncbi:molecular chaperone HscC [Caulobacter sp. NIBR1757]|uniref:Hsp70 family protein n=1 Tax=Caulobacter sp. NIBR1757 TaxID=3016000 RepID=UPI0022F0E21D|nr:molecular chaperone HscC [Caulobacter sp. NIBR1757]WGM39483.1 Chaperone protein HscC [Caulobacter sp. NIBR1757]